MNVHERSRRVLVHGLMLVMMGLVWGFGVPLTPYPRLALTAHIQFMSNGVLIIVMAGLLLTLPHRVGQRGVAVMLAAAWLTWAMALSEVANAWWGTNQMLPIAAAQAGARGAVAWRETLIKLTHIAAGFGLVAAWGILVAGFVRRPAGEGGADGD